MADVDLTVAVTSSGVDGAIANIQKLRKAGLDTGDGMVQLAAASRTASAAVRSLSAEAARDGSSLKGYKATLTATGKEAVSLSQALRTLEGNYSKTAKLNIGGSPADRLAAAGGAGGLAAGKGLAAQIRLMREAYSADPVKDLMAVERQELALLEQRRQRLADIASQQNAKQSNSRAREDMAGQAAGITAVERAQVGLARATQDLARAEAARKATGIGIANTERTAALNAETRAIQQVVAAQRELDNAQATAASHGNAFQSSFSYFIIAGMAQQASQAILGVGVASVTASAEIERSFVDVRRTFDGTESQLTSLRSTIVGLATSTPNSFGDLAEIAALGNQLGVAASNIESFTTTIAQYSTVSGQTAEDAATAFGKIGNLTGLAASQYSNLASSITYVARTSAATEATIQNTAKEITALSAGAGFSAQSIVGLAGALSSLAIPPERARGSLSLYFGALNSAVAEGGPKLAAFATLTGKTADQIAALVRANKGEEVFTSFIAGLSKLDTVAKTTALDALGLSTIRVDQTMRALSQNVPLLTSSLAGADKAFTENTEISRQYAMIQDTLASKIKEFQNAIQLAAGAMGGALAPAVLKIVEALTTLVVGFNDFAQTPIGAVVLTIAGAIAGLVFVIATLVGGLALLKATMTVIPWALTGLSARAASSSLAQFAAGLVGVNLATTGAVGSQTVLATSMRGTAAATGAASLGFKGLKLAIASTGIGLAVVIVGSLISSYMELSGATKTAAEQTKAFFGGAMPELAAALQKDDAVFRKTGESIGTITTNVKSNKIEADSWVGSLERATGAQVALDGGTTTTTEKITSQTLAYGENAKAALASALANTKSFQKLFKDSKAMNALEDASGFDGGEFAAAILGDPVKGGKKYVDQLTGNIAKEFGLSTKELRGELVALDSGFASPNKLSKAQVETLRQLQPALFDVASAAGSTSSAMKNQANQAAATAAANSALTGDLAGTSDGFLGATEAVSAYQDAVSSGIGKFNSFATVLGKVKEAQDAANKRPKGDDGTDTSLINAAAFGRELDAANASAVSFFQGIQTLAVNGRSSFATQLAELGPEAQGILSSALSLDGGGQAQLEASARFAAFIASDAFKKALEAGMSDSNEAYARIFQTTGNLGDVQSYIAAQVAGVGKEWEMQWASNHPNLPLNVEVKNPTPESLDAFKKLASGALTMEASVRPVFKGDNGTSGMEAVKTFTDTLTGATITLPAALDEGTLSTSLQIWQQNEAATPEEIAARLNTPGLSSDLDSWRAAHGNIKLNASVTFTPANSLSALIKQGVIGTGPGKVNAGMFAKGGEIPAFAKGGMPGFAGGGGYGKFRGPGTGTSDSIMARVSAGEYISTKKATDFWGADFMASLNRQMLPTSFLNMLGAASGAGNSGPTHQANVHITQVNPLTRDPLKQLREDSELVASGIWG